MNDSLDSARIGFRPMREEDIPLVSRWRSLPHVRQWWGDDPYDVIVAKLTRRTRGEEPVSCYLILYDGAPIGYIHTYRISDFPDNVARVGPVAEHAAGIDLFIGDERYLHRGLGASLIRAFMRAVVFAAPDVESCLIAPDPANSAAVRAYARAGFRYLRTIPGERPGAPEYLMRLTRSELGAL